MANNGKRKAEMVKIGQQASEARHERARRGSAAGKRRAEGAAAHREGRPGRARNGQSHREFDIFDVTAWLLVMGEEFDLQMKEAEEARDGERYFALSAARSMLAKELEKVAVVRRLDPEPRLSTAA